MPRYFFDVHHEREIPDADGTEMPDLQTMRGEAIRYAGEILKDLGGKFSGRELSMTVRDQSGRTVLVLRFSVTAS